MPKLTPSPADLLRVAAQHEQLANALAQAAAGFTRQGEHVLAKAALETCHRHRARALMARTRAEAAGEAI